MACTGLALSVVHCTQSLAAFTGSHWLLAGTLAVTIDAGMIACEVAEIVSHDTSAYAQVKPWARTYIIMAVLLSMLLNAFGMGMHAEASTRFASYAVGAVIPVLVFVLGTGYGTPLSSQVNRNADHGWSN